MRGILRPGFAVTAVRTVRQGFAWWLRELGGMLPRRLIASLGGDVGGNTVLQVGAARTALLLRGRRRFDDVDLPVVQDQILECKAQARVLLRTRRAGTGVVIELASDTMLQLHITLPQAAEPKLPRVLAHQLERLTPLDANAVSFAFRVVARMPSDKTLKVALVVVKKTTLEAAVRLARDLGLRPASVVGPASGQDTPYTLWRAEGESLGRRHRWWRHGLEVFAVAVLLGSYALHVARLERQRDALQAELADAKRSAADVQALAQRIDVQQKLLAALVARQNATTPLRVLDELTRVIPLDSWIFQFGMSGGVVDISGYAPRATDLIARIETSPLFEKPKFRTPITLGPDGKAEQFSLSFAVKQMPQP
jgi:general secretion pathway protein L